MRDRRQSATTIKAFLSIEDPDIRMIVNTQTNIPGRTEDPRIEYRTQNYPEPKDVYADGDIMLAPMAYGGYERTILESMASGMPCLTTDADPMNLFQHDPDFLVSPFKQFTFSQSYISNTVYNQVSVESMREKISWLLTIPTSKYSHRARAQAVAQSWESTAIDYRKVWLEALGSIL
jgi:glycosyltransferase involved in cell wall biosynthesis